MKTTTKRAAGYTINHEEQTITITRDYAKKSSIPGSKEFRELAKLHAAFPEYTIQRRTANVSENKEKHLGLTVDRMEIIITLMVKEEDEQKAALGEFEKVKSFYKGTKGYYGKIKAWFLKNYEGYAEVDFAA